MATPIRRIGMLTSGGDAPGLNAVIRAVVKTAEIEYGWKVVGIEDGFEGLLTPPRIRNLGLDGVRGILSRGGTILGSTNKGHFRTIEIDGKLQRDPAPYKELAHNMRRLGLDALVIIGGEGSQGIASELAKYGVRAVGVPRRSTTICTAATARSASIQRLPSPPRRSIGCTPRQPATTA
jgi:6-phosphofructokinase 1